MKNDGKVWFRMRKSGLAVEWELQSYPGAQLFIAIFAKTANLNRIVKDLEGEILRGLFSWAQSRKIQIFPC